MNQEQKAALGALEQDCEKQLQSNSDTPKDVKPVGLLQLKDGTNCFLVAIDDRNIVSSRVPLSPSQQEAARAKAKAITGNSKTEFLRGTVFSDPQGPQEQHNTGTKE